ncbi:hypothetical protein FWD20_01730 [Candidatus Saccharibacteria bacterium]|nr:hypothetical protein [Candidatus Saccharibacteria bacterium]
MSEKTKILWSGITGRTGQAALAAQNQSPAEIVAGVSRERGEGYYTYDELDEIREDFDVIVDFSHKDSFDKILAFAEKVLKPLIIGTAGLSEQQVEALENASRTIPIFRGGNFRFEVETFIDDIVAYARTCEEQELRLVETHRKGKIIPSETAKVIAKRVLDETGKIVNIDSRLEYDDPISDWRIGGLHYQMVGFDQLGVDVLEIASIMAGKEPDGSYDLGRLVRESKN